MAMTVLRDLRRQDEIPGIIAGNYLHIAAKYADYPLFEWASGANGYLTKCNAWDGDVADQGVCRVDGCAALELLANSIGCLSRVLAPRRMKGRLMKKYALLACVFILAWAPLAQSHEQKYRVFEMSGLLESPVNDSDGFGTALITFDLDLFTMRVETTFGGLTGTTTNSHIHCCTLPTAGVATRTPTFLDFPEGVTAGSYDHTYNMAVASSYNPAFVTANGNSISAAFEALLAGAESSAAYLNIHSSYRSGGEIRGFLVRVPEPSSFMLALVGIAGAMFRRRRK